MGNLGINIDELPENKSGDYEPLPDGKYIAMITNSQVVNTKSGTGQMLKLTWTIFQEPYAGRLVFDNINIKNDSEKAQEIGLGMLKTLCLAAGKSGVVDDSTELHDLPIIIKVVTDEGDGRYKAQNKVKGYYSKDSTKGENFPAAKELKDDDLPNW